MSTSDDDIEFDFFDEPETQESPQRRRLPRLERPRPGGRPPRPPLRPAAGVTPLLRLIGLVALLIFVVVILVFWVRSCQGASKRASYEHYMDHVRTIAQGSSRLGHDFTTKLTTPGVKAAQLQSAVNDYVQQAEQEVAQAKQLSPPGPLRLAHSHLVEALDLRAKGMLLFAESLRQTSSSKDASSSGALLATQARLLTASDVNWQFFFHDPAVATLKSQDVTGVAVPDSQFLTNPDLVSSTSMVQLFQRLRGASTGGTPSGLHGSALVSVKALPDGTVLSTSEPTTVKASTALAFAVTIQDSGNFQEFGIPVTLTIQASPPIKLRKTIDQLSPDQQKTVTFTNIGQPPFGARTNVKVEVGAVPGEQKLTNNSATYPVFFSIG